MTSYLRGFVNRSTSKEKTNQIRFKKTWSFSTPSRFVIFLPFFAATPSGSPGCSQCPLPARCQVFSPLTRSPSHHPGRRRPESQWYSSSPMGLQYVVHSHQKTGRRTRLQQAQAFEQEVDEDQNWSVLTTGSRRHVSLICAARRRVMRPL